MCEGNTILPFDSYMVTVFFDTHLQAFLFYNRDTESVFIFKSYRDVPDLKKDYKYITSFTYLSERVEYYRNIADGSDDVIFFPYRKVHNCIGFNPDDDSNILLIEDYVEIYGKEIEDNVEIAYINLNCAEDDCDSCPHLKICEQYQSTI